MDLLKAYKEERLLHSDVTEEIISLFYKVYNSLGYGFLEQVYQNALYYELCKNGFECVAQKDINVYYDGRRVGMYRADIVVNDMIIIELKATEEIHEAHINQLTNYLRATEIEVGLLLNFGKKPEFKRRVFMNKYKKGE